MGKFDPIDLFFIKMIVLYFITLGCLIILLLHLIAKNKSKKRHNMELKTPIIEEEPTIILPAIRFEDVNKKAIEQKKHKFKLSDIAIIRKLFMKKITNEPVNITQELKKKSSEVKEVITNIAKTEKPVEKDIVIETPKETKKQVEKQPVKTVPVKDKLDMPKMKSNTTKNKTRANKTKPSKSKTNNKTNNYKKNTNKTNANKAKVTPKTQVKPTSNTPKKKTNTNKPKTNTINNKPKNNTNQKKKTTPKKKTTNTKKASNTSNKKKNSKK